MFLLLDYAADKPWAVIPELPSLPVGGLPDALRCRTYLRRCALCVRPRKIPDGSDVSIAVPSGDPALAKMMRWCLRCWIRRSKTSRWCYRGLTGGRLCSFEPFPEGTPVLLVSSNEQSPA